jgi:hypothetical protein
MAKQKLRFTAKIEGKEAGVVAAITPPVDVPEFFGTRARVPVRGTINGYPFRSSLAPCGGRHMMPVNKLLLAGAGAQPGDVVDVVMERDEEERTVEAPPLLKKALAKNKTAQANWQKLSFTHKKEMALAIRWSETGRDAGAAAGEDHGDSEDGGEVDRVRAQLARYLRG